MTVMLLPREDDCCTHDFEVVLVRNSDLALALGNSAAAEAEAAVADKVVRNVVVVVAVAAADRSLLQLPARRSCDWPR
jgi:hypothetical protein